MGTLSTDLTRIKTAVDRIRVKTDTTGDVIEDVATAVEGMSTKSNIYKVSTIAERDLIDDMVAGDMCVVYGSSLGPIPNVGMTYAIFPTTVTLSDAITSSYEVYFYVNDPGYGYIPCNAQLTNTSFSFTCNNYDTGDAWSATYTSLDGIEYTRTAISPESADDKLTFGFHLDAEFESPDGAFNIIKNFMLNEVPTLDGIFTYDGINWNFIDINSNLTASDVLLGKNAYSNTGMITGNRDINTYNKRHIYLQNTEPEDKTGIWCTLGGGLTSFNYDSIGLTENDVTALYDINYVGTDDKGYRGTLYNKNGANYILYFVFYTSGSTSSDSISGTIINNKFYGYNLSKVGNTFKNFGYIYDFNTKTYSSMPTVPGVSNTYQDMSGSYFYDGSDYLYMFARDTATNNYYLYRYSISNNSWASFTMATGLSGTQGTLNTFGMVINNVAYVALGNSAAPTKYTFVKYDIVNNISSTFEIDNSEISQGGYSWIEGLFNRYRATSISNNTLILHTSTGNVEVDLSQLSKQYLIDLFNNKPSMSAISSYGVFKDNKSYNLKGQNFMTIYDYSTDCLSYQNLRYNGNSASRTVSIYKIDNNKINIYTGTSKEQYELDISDLKPFPEVVFNIQLKKTATSVRAQIFDGVYVNVENACLNRLNKSLYNYITAIYIGDGTSWTLYKSYE